MTILASYRQQRRAAAGLRFVPLVSRLALVAAAKGGRAVRGCGDVVRAGWIARQAIVLGGRRACRA